MKVMVLGGGGREHALCWALSRSDSVDQVLCAPGNAGIARVAELHDVDPTDVAMVRELAVREAVDLVVVGPEAPLAAGVVDTLQTASVPVFGPRRDAARIEASKSFAKDVMTAAGVPTARYWSGSDPNEATKELDAFAPPYVVKADGLAAGKGVRICTSRNEAEEAVVAALVDSTFGDAGSTVVLEEYLRGPEISVFGLCDGEHVVALQAAQDYKRALDGDAGPNTGGMGAYSPVPAADEALLEQVRTGVLEPTLAELHTRGTPFTGVLYAGLVLTGDGPKVLEFNARFGDPETQVVLPRLQSDLGELLLACAQGRLADHPPLRWESGACVGVVLASGGYPGEHRTGVAIEGLDAAEHVPDARVFHAGTRGDGDGVVTSGGRVLTVAGTGATLALARAAAYRAADAISFEGMHRRADIALHPAGR